MTSHYEQNLSDAVRSIAPSALAAVLRFIRDQEVSGTPPGGWNDAVLFVAGSLENIATSMSPAEMRLAQIAKAIDDGKLVANPSYEVALDVWRNSVRLILDDDAAE